MSTEHSTLSVVTDFYNCMLIYCLIQREQMFNGHNRWQSYGKIPYATERTEWHRFLDNLSWLCDSHRGGDTVSSIGVSQEPNIHTFWLAMNRPRLASEAHLVDLLAMLRKCAGTDVKQSEIEEAMFAKCVGFSSQRIYNYRRILVDLVKGANRQLSNEGSARQSFEQHWPLTHIDDSLRNTLTLLVQRSSEHPLLCSLAHDFRNTVADQILQQKVSQCSAEIWPRLRHYIGRLGSWRRAVRFLVSRAPRFMVRLDKHRVFAVPPPMSDGPPSIALHDDLCELVERSSRTIAKLQYLPH
ncbi:hypothetical protein MRB53_038341 [Persea americana]|nr:hypothetical protein MRB53_038341 [Persea americana]